MTPTPRLGVIAAVALLASGQIAFADPPRDYGDRRQSEFVDQPSITLFEKPGFQGKSHTWRGDASDLGDTDFNDHAASVQVHGRWRVCADSKMRGRCEDVLRDLPDLRAVGLDHQISSFAYIGVRPSPVPVPGPPTSSALGADALEGRTAALFRRPTTVYGPVMSRQSEADDYCRAMGYSLSIYADFSGPELRDLVCRR